MLEEPPGPGSGVLGGRLRQFLPPPLQTERAQQRRRLFLCDIRHSVNETLQRAITHLSARFSWSERTS